MHPPPHPANIRWTPAVYREPCSRPGEFMVASQVARNQCRGGARLAVPGDQQRTACTRQAGVPSGERLNSSEVQGCRCSWGLTGPMGIELSSTEVNLRASQMQEGGSFALPMWCPPPPNSCYPLSPGSCWVESTDCCRTCGRAWTSVTRLGSPHRPLLEPICGWLRLPEGNHSEAGWAQQGLQHKGPQGICM